MLTPKQRTLLQSLHPEVLAILDLVPVPSHEFKTNQAIEDRVEQWLDQASKAPIKPRQITDASNLPQVKRSPDQMIQDNLPWDIIDPTHLPVSLRDCNGWTCMSGKSISSPF